MFRLPNQLCKWNIIPLYDILIWCTRKMFKFDAYIIFDINASLNQAFKLVSRALQELFRVGEERWLRTSVSVSSCSYSNSNSSSRSLSSRGFWTPIKTSPQSTLQLSSWPINPMHCSPVHYKWHTYAQSFGDTTTAAMPGGTLHAFKGLGLQPIRDHVGRFLCVYSWMRVGLYVCKFAFVMCFCAMCMFVCWLCRPTFHRTPLYTLLICILYSSTVYI